MKSFASSHLTPKRALYALWVGALAATAVLELTPLELTEPWSHMAVYLVAWFGLPVALWSFAIDQLLLDRPTRVVSLSAGLVLSAAALGLTPIGVRYYSASRQVWRTTTVLYREKNHPRQTIVQQMVDEGALGYRQRFARTAELRSFLFYSVPVTDAEIRDMQASGAWVEVNEARNPFGSKGG